MGLLDDMKNRAGKMGKDQKQDRIRDLSEKEKRGELDDKGREQLNKLRKKL